MTLGLDGGADKGAASSSPALGLFLPEPGSGVSITASEVGLFIANVLVEAERAGYGREEIAHLLDVKSGHGVLASHPAYWRTAYTEPLTRAVQRIFRSSHRPTVLDICAGTGTQALLFALLGATVTALDVDEAQRQVLTMRLGTYRSISGMELPLDVVAADVRHLDISGTFDAIYSHAGWTALADADDLLATAARLLRPGGMLVLKSTNPTSLWARAAKASVPDSSPEDYRRAAARWGFVVREIRGTTSFPRLAWRWSTAVAHIDKLVQRQQRLWVHVELSLERCA